MLTPKMEKFAQGVAEGKTQADAYRASYNAKSMKPETVQNKAHVLMKRGDIRARVEELRAPIVEKVHVTLERHLADLLSLRNMAAKASQFSAAISAEASRGRASGLYIEKVENIGPPPKIIINRPNGD